MASRRDDALAAAAAAAHLHEKFPLGHRTGFDVVRATIGLGHPLLFRPLDGLWGATVTPKDGQPGILISTVPSRAIQRFTLAHELGHLELGHKMKYEFLTESADLVDHHPGSSNDERAAERFASELLASKRLIMRVVQMQEWSPDQLIEPGTIYQLSLRLGTSFRATCWALVRESLLNEDEASHILRDRAVVKKAKTAVLGTRRLTDPWADAWTISPRDAQSVIECGPGDLFSVTVADEASAGYLWELVGPEPSFSVVEERPELDESIGAPNNRTIVLECRSQGTVELGFVLRRPWSGERAESWMAPVDTGGRLKLGFPPSRKHALLTGGKLDD